MSISLVGSTGASTGGNSGPLNINYTSTAGNLLVLAFLPSDDNGDWGSSPFSSVTDSAGNTWHYSTANSSANPPFSWINSSQFTVGIGAGIAWTFQNAGHVTGSSAVVWHNNAGVTVAYDLLYTLSEWSGVSSVEAANFSNGTTSGSAGISAGNISLNSTGDVVVGTQVGNTTGRPAGSSQFSGTTANHTIWVSPGITGTYTANWASGSGNDYATAVIALLPTGSAAPAVTPPVRPLIVNSAISRAGNW